MSKKKKIIGGIIGLSAVVGAVCLINKGIFYYSTLKKVVDSENSHIYKWRFGNIFYTKCGQGRPILLVHDLNSAASSYEWKSIVGRLSKKYTVYTVDLIGCGRSDKPKMTYTNYLYVQLLNDFVREIIKAKTDIITSGSSGALGIMACHMEPDLYRKMMMINPQNPKETMKSPGWKQKLFKYVIETPILGTLIYNLRNAFYSTKRTFAKQYYHEAHLISKDDVKAYYQSAHFGGSASRYLYGSIHGYYTAIPVQKAVKEDNHSIVIVGGSKVNGIEETMDAYRHLNSSIETVVANNTKLLPQLEKPEQLMEFIDIYL